MNPTRYLYFTDVVSAVISAVVESVAETAAESRLVTVESFVSFEVDPLPHDVNATVAITPKAKIYFFIF